MTKAEAFKLMKERSIAFPHKDIIAAVTDTGALFIDSTEHIKAQDAIALAHWILDTFEKEEE